MKAVVPISSKLMVQASFSYVNSAVLLFPVTGSVTDILWIRKPMFTGERKRLQRLASYVYVVMAPVGYWILSKAKARALAK